MTNIVKFPDGAPFEDTLKEPAGHVRRCVERIVSRLPFINKIMIVTEDHDGRVGMDESVMGREDAVFLTGWLDEAVRDYHYGNTTVLFDDILSAIYEELEDGEDDDNVDTDPD